MKQRGWFFLGLGLSVSALCACTGKDNSNGAGSQWLSVDLARAVDRQLGPKVPAGAGAALTQDAGSHSADGLQGEADLSALVDAVREIEEGHFGGGPDYQLPAKEISGKLSALARAVGTDYGQACEQDNDGDGVPDVQEPLGQGGLCLDPGSVSCSETDTSFTIKFSDCVVARGGSTLTATWGYPSGSFWQTAGVTTVSSAWTATWSTCTGMTVPACTGTATVPITVTGTYTPLIDVRYTNTTTSGQLTPTFTVTSGTVTPCAVPGAGGTVTSGEVQGLRGSGTSGSPITATATVSCAPVSPTSTPVCFTWQWATQFTWVTNLTTRTWADVVYNGDVTLHQGTAAVDEQLLYTRYDNLTKLWDVDGTGLTDSNPFLIYNGQILQYQVLTPLGAPAVGSTCMMRGCDLLDGMMLEDLQITLDRDGLEKPGYQTGDYPARRGSDFEDGAFLFTGPTAIVLSRDKQGGGVSMMSPAGGLMVQGPAAYLVGQSKAGLPIYALSLYDRDTLPEQTCGDPVNLPCWVKVEMNSKARTFNVLEAENCAQIDPTAGDWNEIPF